MMNTLFLEIYVDRIPSMHLLYCCPQFPISFTQYIRLVKKYTPMTAYTSYNFSPTLMHPDIVINILGKIHPCLSCPRNYY